MGKGFATQMAEFQAGATYAVDLRGRADGAVYSNYTLQEDKKLRETFRTVVTVDNKPIYDHTLGDGVVVKDKRVAIDMLLVRRDIRDTNMELRWVDTRQMIADSFTKTTADPSFLRFLFKHGEYIVVQEDRSLQWRLQEREKRKEARGRDLKMSKGRVKAPSIIELGTS